MGPDLWGANRRTDIEMTGTVPRCTENEQHRRKYQHAYTYCFAGTSRLFRVLIKRLIARFIHSEGYLLCGSPTAVAAGCTRVIGSNQEWPNYSRAEPNSVYGAE